MHGPVRAIVDHGGESAHQARLTAVVELIKKLTGRDVELVPPSPYLVSGPARPEPVTIEYVAAHTPKAVRERSKPEPVRVDITEVLERGTTPRMRLTDSAAGTLVLQPELDVTL